MKHITLEALPRITSGTGGAHKVRAEGYVPGILLGHHEPAVTLKVKTSDMFRVLKNAGPNALLDLNIDGTSTFAMIREFTRHPVSRDIIHVDFMRVAANEPIEAPVSILIVGEPAIEYADYIVAQELNAVRVKALPDALPSRIEVDAATLLPGHPLHAADLPMPEGVELKEEPTTVVVVLAAPKLQREAAEDEAAAAPPAAPAAEATEDAGEA